MLRRALCRRRRADVGGAGAPRYGTSNRIPAVGSAIGGLRAPRNDHRRGPTLRLTGGEALVSAGRANRENSLWRFRQSRGAIRQARQAQHVGRHGRVAQPHRRGCRRRRMPSPPAPRTLSLGSCRRWPSTEKGDEGDARKFHPSPSSLRRITSFSRDYDFTEAVLPRLV